jgi:hypothetical protein
MVNIALGGGQLILSVLQLGVGVVKEVGLEVRIAISPHQLIVQLLDTRLKVGALLKKLPVTLLSGCLFTTFGYFLLDFRRSKKLDDPKSEKLEAPFHKLLSFKLLGPSNY